MSDTYASRHTAWSTAEPTTLRALFRRSIVPSLWVRVSLGNTPSGRRPDSAPCQPSSSNVLSDRNCCWPAVVRVCQGHNR